MNRGFKGIWIPADVWLSKDLTMQEKIFLVEIDSLDNGQGCFASNAYFADFFGLCKTRVSQILSSMNDKGYILCKFNKDQRRLVVNPAREITGKNQFSDRIEIEEEQTIMPFGSAEFSARWKVWKEYLKRIGKPYKNPIAEQAMLKILAGYKEPEAIDMIENAIARNWNAIYAIHDYGTRKKNGERTIDFAGIGNQVDQFIGRM